MPAVFAFLIRPSRAAVLYALRSMTSALVALLVGRLIGLDYPHWAAMTVLIVAQPTRGMVFAKGLYRGLGTCIGAAAGATILHVLRDQPAFLVLALAIWIGLSTAATNLLRGYRSYAAVLSAVTAPLIALLAFEHPDTVTQLAEARLGGIFLGIAVSALSASLLLAHSDRERFIQRMRDCSRQALDWSARVIAQGPSDDLRERQRKLLEDFAGIDDQADQVAAGSVRLRTRLRYLRGLMASLLSLMASARAIGHHRKESDPPLQGERFAQLAATLEGASASLGCQPLSRQPLPRRPLARRPLARRAGSMPATPDIAVVDDHIAAIERSLARVEADAGALSAASSDTVPPPAGKMVFHRDWPAARMTGVRAFLAIAAVGAIWRLTGWESGGPMLMTSSIMCAIFAAHPMPAPAIRGSLLGAFVATLAAVLYRFLLPGQTTGLTMTVITIAPLLFLGCMAMANRASVYAGTDFCMMFLFQVEPGAVMTHTAGQLVGIGSGIVAGVAAVALVLAFVMPIDPVRRMRVLRATIVDDIRSLAQAGGFEAALHRRARLQHRVLRLAVLAGGQPGGQADERTRWLVDGGLDALAAAQGLVRAHDQLGRTDIPPDVSATVRQALQELARADRSPLQAQTRLRETASLLSGQGRHHASAAASRAALLEIADALGAGDRFFDVSRA